MRYKRLNNFPKELLSLLKDEWNEIRFSDYDEIPCVEPSLKMIICKSLNEKFQKHFKVKIQGIVFAVSNCGVAKIHTDKSRYTTLNVPIHVDSYGDFVCGKTIDLEPYGEPMIDELDGKISTEYTWNPSLYEFVPMDTPIVINTKVPHAWCGNKDSERVIASFMFEDGIKPEELINSTPSDWF
mgnify:FL=1|tara:strand:- start:684 stop:1232 length:549 start_codon:yes stop_codon:yes gene_type:complete